MSVIRLSPSKLGVLRDCARCFFDAEFRKLKHPETPFPSITGGIDREMKKYFDGWRSEGHPPMLAGLTGRLYPVQSHIDQWRNWRSGLKARIQIGSAWVELIGALDEAWVEADGSISPVDGKSKGDVPKDDGAQYYHTQLDCYALMLNENGFTASGQGYLAYTWPVACAGAPGSELMSWTFLSRVYAITASAERAIRTLEEAVNILQGFRPAPNPLCNFCRWAQEY